MSGIKVSKGVVSGNNHKTPILFRNKRLVTALVLIVIVTSIAYFVREFFYVSQCNGVAGNEIYTSIVRAVEKNDVRLLTQLEDTIRNEPRYNNDINCKIGLFYKELYSGQFTNAEEIAENSNQMKSSITRDFEAIGITKPSDLSIKLNEYESSRSEQLNEVLF